MSKLILSFPEGAGSVTGANILLQDPNSKIKILFDCGLVQGHTPEEDSNWEPFPYDPAEIDFLIISHAHIDHIGKIPKLINDGFKGQIISTDATMDLARPMLEDTAHILSKDIVHKAKSIYTSENINKAMNQWVGKKYYEEFIIGGNFHIKFLDSGHILGSAITRLFFGNSAFYYTGDLGNSPSPLLRDTDDISDAKYMVMESVYGDRNHEHRAERTQLLERVLEDTYSQKATLVMPLFSLERTQDILYEMNDFVVNNRIPKMQIFLDSPLGIKLTDVYKKYTEYFNETAKKRFKEDGELFSFPGLHLTTDTSDSKAIMHAPNPKIIMAGSGMSNGGRVIHHEKNYLPDKNNILLLTGYQTMGTLGRKIEDGAKTVRIMGEEVAVRAQVRKIEGYSGHKDSDHLVEFVSKSEDTLEKLFIALGENKSSMFLAQKLKDKYGIDSIVPEKNQSFELEF